MSLRFRLIGLVCLILLASFVAGGVIAGISASRSVRIEMHAALRVGRQTVAIAVERLHSAADPSRDLNDLVASFEGNRHLRVWLVGEAAHVAKPALESSPFGRAPFWFTDLVGVAPLAARVPAVLSGRDYATVAIETDPHNELQEAWTAFATGLAAQAVFYVLTIAVIYVFVGCALRPLGDLAAALERVGDGRHRTRLSGRLAPELARLRDSFNRMTARLTAGNAENQRLNEQLMTLQEQERCDLARDLHDEVSPYLFAINADATTTSRLLKEGLASEAHRSLDAILDAVRHMQRQVRLMLGRLRPIGLDDFGLTDAIDNIVAFWRRRRPEICCQVTVCDECEGLGGPVGTTICRIVQECLSNAVRHAAPALITVTVDCDHDDRNGCDRVKVEIADDGCGMSEQHRVGYGLLGISERVKAVGGELTFSNRSTGGFAVIAVIPWEPSRDAINKVAQAVEP